MRKLAITALAFVLSAAIACAQGITGTVTTQVVIVPTSTAYSAGQCFGNAGASAIQPLANLILPSGPGGTWFIGVTLVDSTGSDPAIDFLVFNNAPVGTYTDHANCVVNASDQSYLQGFVSITSTNCIQDQSAATGICQVTGALLIPLTANFSVTGPSGGGTRSNTIWIVPIMRGTPTYGSSKSIYINYKAYPDAATP